MKIAVPLVDCRLATRFGHCTSFALFDVDQDKLMILRRQDIPAPEHQPGLLPSWLAKRGVNMVIAGGIGKRAMELLAQHRISIVAGAEKDVPEKLVANHLAGNTEYGRNPCDDCFTVTIKLPGNLKS